MLIASEHERVTKAIMYCVKDGLVIATVIFVGFIHAVAESGKIVCSNTVFSNGTSGSSCDVTTTPSDGAKQSEFCCSTVLYIVIIGFGILTVPIIICIRVCWVLKKRKRERRQLNDASRFLRARVNQQPSIFTVQPGTGDFIFVSSPPSYDVACPSGRKDDRPPPYDLPPPYSAKEGDKAAEQV